MAIPHSCSCSQDFSIMDTGMMYFMYHHCIYCVLKIEKKPVPSPETFTLFPLLPTELRLKIWQTITNTPRNVELTCTPTSSHLPEGKWFSHSKSPAIFRVCFESRAIALSTYSTLAFFKAQIGVPCNIPLHINFSVDTLWLCGDLGPTWARDLLEVNEQLKAKLKYLAVNEKLWGQLNDHGSTYLPYTDPVERALCSKMVVLQGLKAIKEVRFHS